LRVHCESGLARMSSNCRKVHALMANRSVKADPLLQAIACIGSAYLQR